MMPATTPVPPDAPARGSARRTRLLSVVLALAIFALCVAVRASLECGFILGDDPAVVGVVDVRAAQAPWVLEQVNLRFGVWAPYLLFRRLFGTGELMFFAASWIVSSSFGAVAYLLLRAHGYSVAGALFGGLFVGLSPFEVLIGATIANDLWFAAALVYAYVAWQGRDRVPLAAGLAVATLLWFAFFNKAWAVYVGPFLAIDLARDLRVGRRLRFWAALAAGTGLLHLATAVFFKRVVGEYFPLLRLLPAHYPVPSWDLPRVLLTYPSMLLLGDSDTGTTLFGVVPYVWLMALAAVAIGCGARRLLRDRFGAELLLMWLGMFALINFVPNYYSLTEYHSAPRIFRYLTPISFFLSLHAAKLLLDWARLLAPPRPRLLVPAALALLVANVNGAWGATAPGRENRRVVEAVVARVTAPCPPVFFVDSWQGSFFNRFYLRDRCPATRLPLVVVYRSGDPQTLRALREEEKNLPDGALAVTGLGSCVHYSCFACHIEPRALVTDGRAGSWVPGEIVGRLTYRPTPVDVQLWRWKAAPAPGAQAG